MSSHSTEEKFLRLPSTAATEAFGDIGRSYIYKAVTSGSTKPWRVRKAS